MEDKYIRVTNFLNDKHLSMAYLTNPTTLNYFTGLEIDPHERIAGLMIFPDKEPLLFLPALEVDKARSLVTFEVFGYQDSENPWQVIQTKLSSLRMATLAVEFTDMTLAKSHGLQSVLSAELVDISPLIQHLRMIKNPDEIDKLKLSGVYADRCFEIGFAAAQVGMTETALVSDIEFGIKKEGITHMSFDTIVLSGERAANPHGIPGSVPISKNKFLLFDLGTMKHGWASDATRTIALGQVSQFDHEIYQLVLEAQLAAQSYAKPGVSAQSVDRVARDIITKAGYGDYFNHRLGHGIGMDVHEYPSIVNGEDLLLEVGMCFSIEPGIYIPDKVGVRIEDCVYLTAEGAKPLTKTSKELMVF